MSRRSSLTHTAYHCMVVLSGTSLADSLLPWRLPSIIFSDEFGGSQETATLRFCIKLHILTVFSTKLYVYLTIFQERTCEPNSYFLQESFTLFNNNVFTPAGSNRYCAHKYMKLYFKEDCICADFARHLLISSSGLRETWTLSR